MYITWFGPPNARAAAMEASDEEEDPELVVLVRDGTLCMEPAELVRFFNELDECRCCCEAWTKELYPTEL